MWISVDFADKVFSLLQLFFFGICAATFGRTVMNGICSVEKDELLFAIVMLTINFIIKQNNIELRCIKYTRSPDQQKLVSQALSIEDKSLGRNAELS